MTPTITMKCFSCGWPGLTWMEKRQSYARMVDAGLTPEEAKRRSPCCYRCIASMLRPITPVSVIGEISDQPQYSIRAPLRARRRPS
jgi:hypothetical protein